MADWRYIIITALVLCTISCNKVPVYQESWVPEIVSVTSIPETHSVTLKSDLNAAPYGNVECGFYFGTDKMQLEHIQSTLIGKSFTVSIDNLQEGTTYYFKAFIGNGINEITSGIEYFITDVALEIPEVPSESIPEDPVPENPVPEDPPTEQDPPTDPENQTPQDPAPEDPAPEDPPTDPQQPTEPEVPVEFTVEILGVSAHYNDYILELTAMLSGDVSLVTECWFLVGTSPEKLNKIKGSLEDGAVMSYLAGLSPATYYYKAVITNGTDTKESEMNYYELD